MSSLSPMKAQRWQNIIAREASVADLQSSLKELISDLFDYYEQPVVILIDEYDSPVIEAYQNNYYAEFQTLLTDLIRNLVSYHDVGKYPEAAYHCFVLGLLVSLRTVYDISSNPESGYGRADIIMRSKSPNCPLSFIIEFKVIDKDGDSNQVIETVLEQIETTAYASRLTEAGIEAADIRKLAIVIKQQQVTVKSATIRH